MGWIVMGKKTSRNNLLEKIIASGTATDYTGSNTAIFRLYSKWKKTQKVPGGKGRPKVITVDEAREGIQQELDAGALGGSKFQLCHMKNVFEEK